MGNLIERRNGRVANMIREQLSRVLLEEISDPRLQGITVRDVTVSKDLKSARIFYGAGMAKQVPEREMQRGWKNAAPFFKRRLGESLGLRYVPELMFEPDKKGDEVMALYDLMEDIKVGPGDEE